MFIHELVLSFTLSACISRDVNLVVEDSDPAHVYPPGHGISVQVTAALANAPWAPIYVQWVDADGVAQAKKVMLTLAQTKVITTPADDIGYYGLRIFSPMACLRFAPQNPGTFVEYGFSVLPSKQTRDRRFLQQTVFSMIQGDISDPYLTGYNKTTTWASSPRSIVDKLVASRKYGLEEVLLVYGDGWDTPDFDATPISVQALDRLGAKLSAVLDEIQSRELDAPLVIQFGLEDNRGDIFDNPFYIKNLEAKLIRVHAELDTRKMNTLVMTNTRGLNAAAMREISAILNSPAASYIDIFSHNLYNFNRYPENFPAPESWLKNTIQAIHLLIRSSVGGPKDFMIGELGLPVQGNRDPRDFFGYPVSNTPIKGASLGYQASYLVKSHVIAAATRLVKRVFLYNYQDRGVDIHYAERHFGIRSYAPKDDKGRRTLGHPKPAYNAYATMVNQLENMQFTRSYRVDQGIYVYEFASRNLESTRRCLVAWSYPIAKKKIALADLRVGLSLKKITAAVDLYGRPLRLVAGRTELTTRPIYVDFTL